MKRTISMLAMAGALTALLSPTAIAVTRDVAELQPARLTFGRSVLNQMSFGTYREPFDELQTRSYNLLPSNIGRHSNLTPWLGQEGSYSRYVNALIGNNGVSNVESSGIDSIQGSLIRRETASLAWGSSVAFLSGDGGSNDASPTTTFTDVDDLSGWDLRGGASYRIGQSFVLGAGVRAIQASREVTDSSFEQEVGGFISTDDLEQDNTRFDVGVRHFLTARSSWEAQVMVGSGTFENDEISEGLDAAGVMTDRLVIANYDVTDSYMGIEAGYNRLRADRIGETEYRVGYETSEREIDDPVLSFSEEGGVVTPSLTLLGGDPIDTTGIMASARTIFQAGQTELFAGAQFGHTTAEGSTSVDAAGTIVNEAIDDTQTAVGLTLGLRQPLFEDKLRVIVSGRADYVDLERNTIFETSSDSDESTQTFTQYAVGLEGVMANVTFDLAWLFSEEASVPPVDVGLPAGSRRVVDLDGLVISAAVSW